MRIDLSQLAFVDRKLSRLTDWLETRTRLEYKITSLYRPESDGVHGTLPVRGVDLSMPDEVLGIALVALINHWWHYDFARPEMKCAIYHNVGFGPHLHIQVHPATQGPGLDR